MMAYVYLNPNILYGHSHIFGTALTVKFTLGCMCKQMIAYTECVSRQFQMLVVAGGLNIIKYTSLFPSMSAISYKGLKIAYTDEV